MSMLGALIGIGFAAGILLIAVGLRPAPQGTDAPPTRGSSRSRPAWTHLTQRERLLGGTGLAMGILLALFMGWVVAVLVVPLALIGVPRLLSTSDKGAIDRLEAIEEWVRSLRGMLGASVPLATAIVQTLPSAPKELQVPLERLVARIHAHQPLDHSLYRFAADINSQVGDFVAASLIQASRVSGAGLTRTLDGIATEVAAEVRMRRDIAVERDKVVTQARWLTIITVVLVSGVVLLTSLGEAYRTPGGQIVLLVLVGAFGLCLRWIQVRSRSKPAPRFLIEPGSVRQDQEVAA